MSTADKTSHLDHTVQYDLVRAGDQPARGVDWLWPERIPLGKVTLLVGDPGLGKSLIALDVASRVSRGAHWPDQGSGFGVQNPNLNPEPRTLNPPGSVLILSAEDDLADTIRPRLDACGADCDHVFLLPSVADLRHDFGQLRDSIDRMSDCRLIVVDPLNAYVGPNDTHFQVVVRRVLAPLARLALQRRIAVLAVAHLRKSHGPPIYRTAGSMGFVSAARAVWVVGRDPTDAGRKLLLPLKTNLTAAASGLAYRIESQPPLGVPAIVWEESPVTTSADEALAAQPRPQPPSPDRTAARAWLCEALTAGPRPAKELIDEGQRRGFLRRTLQRAFHELEGHTTKRGLVHGWWWALGPDIETAEGPKSRDIFEDVTAVPPDGLAFSPAESMAFLDRILRRRDNDAK
jgi:hypothetical protein